MRQLLFVGFFLLVFTLVLIIGIGMNIMNALERALVGPPKIKDQ